MCLIHFNNMWRLLLIVAFLIPSQWVLASTPSPTQPAPAERKVGENLSKQQSQSKPQKIGVLIHNVCLRTTAT